MMGAGLLAWSIALAADKRDCSITIRVLDGSGLPIPTAYVVHQEELFRHPVNSFDGSFSENILYLPDGSEIVFEAGMELEFEVVAPGYVPQRVVILVAPCGSRSNVIDLTLQPLVNPAPVATPVLFSPTRMKALYRWRTYTAEAVVAVAEYMLSFERDPKVLIEISELAEASLAQTSGASYTILKLRQLVVRARVLHLAWEKKNEAFVRAPTDQSMDFQERARIRARDAAIDAIVFADLVYSQLDDEAAKRAARDAARSAGVLCEIAAPYRPQCNALEM